MAKQRYKRIRGGRLVREALWDAPMPSDPPRARAEKSKNSSAARQRLNDRYSWQKLKMVLAANFTGSDLVATLTFDDEHLPPDRAAARKIIRKFFTQLRAHRKARGEELRYVYVIEDKHGDGRLHYHVVINGTGAAEAVVHTDFGDLIPSSAALSGAGVELVGTEGREFVLKNALAPLKDSYDVILIDCPPSLELLTLNALCAADSVLIPVQCEYYALEGLSDLMTTMRAVKRRLNPKIEIFGVLLTMYDGRTNFSAQVAEEVRRHFPGKVFASMIPRNVRLSEAPSHGLPVFAYDRFSRGARAYLSLAEEILKKLKNS